ncbi:hypothetical protein [Saccharopolyspora shandongensis]|uniref:hypothetical protein n=1 Tax=Saccharopolyspora shandongensis TaxID=418495 RepID=UPI0033C1C41D
MAETGVKQDYQNETVHWLVNYTKDLIEGITNATDAQFSYWRNYLTRAQSLLADAAAALDEHEADRVNTEARGLGTAIDRRAAAIDGSSADTNRRSRSPEEQSRSSKRQKTA